MSDNQNPAWEKNGQYKALDCDDNQHFNSKIEKHPMLGCDFSHIRIVQMILTH